MNLQLHAVQSIGLVRQPHFIAGAFLFHLFHALLQASNRIGIDISLRLYRFFNPIRTLSGRTEGFAKYLRRTIAMTTLTPSDSCTIYDSVCGEAARFPAGGRSDRPGWLKRRCAG